MAQQCKYDLETVKQLVREQKVTFSTPSRSLNKVVEAYALTSPKDLSQAREFVMDGLLKLTKEDFCARGLQWGVVTDIYGVILDGKPWYVKFYIAEEDGCLEDISFHLTEEELTLANGVKIPKGA